MQRQYLTSKANCLLFGFVLANPTICLFGGTTLMWFFLLILLLAPAKVLILTGVLFVKELLGFPGWLNHGAKMS